MISFRLSRIHYSGCAAAGLGRLPALAGKEMLDDSHPIFYSCLTDRVQEKVLHTDMFVKNRLLRLRCPL
jgi:hypothetical protein